MSVGIVYTCPMMRLRISECRYVLLKPAIDEASRYAFAVNN